MSTQAKIAIYEPRMGDRDRYFTFHLKNSLNEERPVFRARDRVLVIPWSEESFHALRDTLLRHRVIDEKNKWIFGDGHLVIIGNYRKAVQNLAECLWFIYGLEERAFRKGGYIHFLPTPHERSSTNGSWRQETPNYAFKKRSRGKSYAVIYDGNNELSRWLSTKNIVEKIGDILFSYGEEVFEAFKAGCSIADINRAAKAGKLAISGKEPAFQSLASCGIAAVVTGNLLTRGVTMFSFGKRFDNHPAASVGDIEALLILNGVLFWLSRSGEKVLIQQNSSG